MVPLGGKHGQENKVKKYIAIRNGCVVESGSAEELSQALAVHVKSVYLAEETGRRIKGCNIEEVTNECESIDIRWTDRDSRRRIP